MTKDYTRKLIPLLKAEGYIFERSTKHGSIYSHPTRPTTIVANNIETDKIYRHELRKLTK